jgi:hypothetical protein
MLATGLERFSRAHREGRFRLLYPVPFPQAFDRLNLASLQAGLEAGATKPVVTFSSVPALVQRCCEPL